MWGKARKSLSSSSSGPLSKRLANDLMHKETTLNLYQEVDLIEMLRSIPEFVAGMKATQGWAFCHPPTVKWPKIGAKMDKEFELVLKRHYMPFRWQSYVRGMLLGIVPYKFYDEGGWWVPRIPIIGTGCIRQYFDYETEKMVYLWYWYDRPNTGFDPDMRFKVWHEPDIYGNYTSPAVSALGTWKIDKLVQQGAQRIIHQMSNMPYFMVHKPPKGKPGDEKFPIDFGDDEELDVERDRFNRLLEKGTMSRNAVKDAVAQSKENNTGLKRSRDPEGMTRPHAPLLNSESIAEVEKREGHDILERLVYLDDFWEPMPVPPPTLPVDPLEYAKRSGQIAASLVDFPLSMVIEQHAQHAGNFDAQITFARDRMKMVMADMSDFLKEVILDAERDMFRNMFFDAAESENKTRKRNLPLTEEELIALYRDVRGFEVEQQCTPLVTLEQLTAVYEACTMDQRTFAEEVFHLLGIPKHRIGLTPVKRAIELENEKMEIEKKTANATIETEKKRLKIDEKVAETEAKTAVIVAQGKVEADKIVAHGKVAADAIKARQPKATPSATKKPKK